MLLRLTQHAEGKGHHRVEIALEGDGARRTAESYFSFALSDQDEEDFRWYLEDFLQYPHEPAPTIARRIEKRIGELGTELFRGVFHGSDDTRDLWAQVRDRLAEIRLEVVTDVAEATTIPWELLRDPKTDEPLALLARSFVRAQPASARRPSLPTGVEGPARILLVLCRPGGTDDVPFRSVANRLIMGLDELARSPCDLEVLRPPTFEQLGRVLRQAKEAGRPYHVVHFDGHGVHDDLAGPEGERILRKRGWSRVTLGRREGAHGYLAFENPTVAGNLGLVDGPMLGRVLAEAGVPVLVLNACRSAYAEAKEAPATAVDPHSQIRAYGSLAQEVMDAGVGGVVAMRYNVYVVTAAQLVAELYASLSRGSTLGEAATLARKNLADQPLREIAAEPIPLQDWMVPVVYEAAPLRLFPAIEGETLDTPIDRAAVSAVVSTKHVFELPSQPDVGFYGRDETLLALDRAFDRDRVVLLHAYAGSGKTATAAEFARWYTRTGGVRGPVLFTSLEHHLPLPRLLDRLGEILEVNFERQGVHWLALDDASRRRNALEVLQRVPVFWIWDNVEQVAGFPVETSSVWSEAEQKELADFLRAVRSTKAKILLTSRRDERHWLGDLPTRVKVPPMPMLERLQLARALFGKHNRKLSQVGAWRPLLAFTDGNPLALTVLVGQALRDGLNTTHQIEAFVARLRSGESTFADDAGEGRSSSLGASLAYGFEHAFSEEERRRLALLFLFQGYVNVGVLVWMGNPKNASCLYEVRGLGKTDWSSLFDRATEIGLLATHGGYYSIHPAIPWFLRGLFEKFFLGQVLSVSYAWVDGLAMLGNYYWQCYELGDREVIASLRAEEINLLHCRQLARAHGWWEAVTGAMQGLQQLYAHEGRGAEWKRLVEELVPDYVDLANDAPLPGREDNWALITSYRVRLAREERKWHEAERLQEAEVKWNRQKAFDAQAPTTEQLNDEQRHRVWTLAASLQRLGSLRRELGRADCVSLYEEALQLSERIGNVVAAAICAYNLGTACIIVPDLRDLAKAKHWYQRSLGLHPEHDGIGRGRCIAQLGSVALEQFLEAQATNPRNEILSGLLNESAHCYLEALELFPQDAVADLAVTHSQLGEIFLRAGDAKRSLYHYRRSIKLKETQGDSYGAAQMRLNIAAALAYSGQLEDAVKYIDTALQGLEIDGESAAAMIQRSRDLINDTIGQLQSLRKDAP